LNRHHKKSILLHELQGDYGNTSSPFVAVSCLIPLTHRQTESFKIGDSIIIVIIEKVKFHTQRLLSLLPHGEFGYPFEGMSVE
jgi:hypothetical protein